MTVPVAKVEYQNAIVFNSGILSLATPFESGTEVAGSEALGFVLPHLDKALSTPLDSQSATMRLISACTFNSYPQFLQAFKAALYDTKVRAFEDAIDKGLTGEKLRRLLFQEERGSEVEMSHLLRSSL